jgi:hypothetical protein
MAEGLELLVISIGGEKSDPERPEPEHLMR